MIPASWVSPAALRWNGRDLPLPLGAGFALPGETVTLALENAANLVLDADTGTVAPSGAGTWTWTAPARSGAATLRLLRPDGATQAVVHAFVLVPYAQLRHGVIDGYSIGGYPAPRTIRTTEYVRPAGFVRVDAASDTMHVSPHFTLGQFVCKAGDALPKFVVLQPTLIAKLERLLTAVHAHGIDATTLDLMSAYRTPRYNRGIGNVTTYSRHEYGDAADVIVDVSPRDGRMDDLNHDGRVDRRDAQTLRGWAQALEDTATSVEIPIGGLSDYSSTDTHGPFVHMDARGFAARW